MIPVLIQDQFMGFVLINRRLRDWEERARPYQITPMSSIGIFYRNKKELGL
jgi:hypothetical protein